MARFFNYKTLLTAGMCALFLVLASLPAQAQLRYGFKTGLNFSKMDGPSEMSTAGTGLESWSTITGFHIGLSLAYKLNDAFGIRSELLYTKKGSKYTFKGPSYRVFRYDGGSTLTYGNSDYLININNAYIDLPVFVYGRWKDFELSAGAYVGLMVQSIGEGSLSYTNGLTYPLENSVANLEFNLDHNYRKDQPGGSKEGQTLIAQVDANTLQLPKTLGAYYDYTEDKGSLYNTLDYGLVAGFSYYLSRSLFIGVRLQYGLADITNNDADISRADINGENFILRDDKDRNVVIQASVGFSF
ncbi:MAG: PorT family protein [Bacteroidetes bacterium]|nr:MAG: PorT family protein [Bacteroidota bacterium]